MSLIPRVTPMLQQYFEAKASVGDALLLYRMGDFYELFFDDAKVASRLLGLTLTARHRDSDVEAPMCGVPHHAVEGYIAQLVAAGYRVAVCDQVEDARRAKGLVRREVTRVVSPGTFVEAEGDAAASPRHLAAVAPARGGVGIAVLDLGSGRFRAGTVPENRISEIFGAYPPAEVLLAEGEEAPAGLPGVVTRRPARDFSPGFAEQEICRAFSVASVRSLGFDPGEPALAAAWAALAYARESRRSDALHVEPPSPLAPAEHLVLDPTTLAHLEIFESADPRSSATLFSVLDACSTAMGSRALREALARPLRARSRVEERLDAVEELAGGAQTRAALREALASIGDLERKVSRIALGSAGPRDVAALGRALGRIPDAAAILASCAAPALQELARSMPDCVPIAARIIATLSDDPPAQLSAGGAVREEADEELAGLRALQADSRGALARFEAAERARSGIATLRVRYNRVFGYFLEVSRAQKDRVPADYVRRQTLANAERYTTPELSELESRILGAEEKILEIESRIFAELCGELARSSATMAGAARRLAAADLLAGLAETAVRRGYCRPALTEEGGLRVVEGRHPVVEAVRAGEAFVPNDLTMTPEARIHVLTGPNMGGKSTFLRQSALIALMARAGSFVPAREAAVGPVDRIFTRIGASDHLARGESTFMVEMIETANILRNATSESLVILDEIGRGTSTFDGLALAWAIVEALHDAPERRPYTLFATHYHEMTELASARPGVANFTMAVREWEGKVVFLRKVVAGAADRSYGIHVAELAGIPAPVIGRAREILENLERQELDLRGQPRFARHEGEASPPGQMPLFSGEEELVLDALRGADVDRMMPVAALSLLATLQDRLRK